MGKLVDFTAAKDRQEHARKAAKVKNLKGSFRASREDASTKVSGEEKLKKMFKGRIKKNKKK